MPVHEFKQQPTNQPHAPAEYVSGKPESRE
jgi:hypothetical protein